MGDNYTNNRSNYNNNNNNNNNNFNRNSLNSDYHQGSYNNNRRHQSNNSNYNNITPTNPSHRNNNYDSRSSYNNHNRNYDREDYDDYSGGGRGYNHRRRSRSRSRSPQRSHRSRGYQSNYRESDEGYNHGSSSRDSQTPNSTLMIRNLPQDITEKDLSNEINQLGLYPKDVRLMRHKDSGHSRGFAFIEFSNIEHAIQLMETTDGYLVLNGGEHECPIHYSLPRNNKNDGDFGNHYNLDKADWICLKCSITNFQRREECFRCGTRRDATPEEIAQSTPTSSILLKNLIPSVNEAKILEFIGNLTALPIKSIKFQSDPMSGQRYCTIELHSVQESEQLYQTLGSPACVLAIDGSPISFSYGSKFPDKRFNTFRGGAPAQPYMNSNPIQPMIESNSMNQAALAALAAAQWNNLGSSNDPTQAKAAPPSTVSKFPPPNYAAFQYDATSGFYYDSTTGYYYDSNSQYFYNSASQKYMYYDIPSGTYIQVDGSASSTPTATAVTTKTETPVATTPDKVAATANPISFMPPIPTVVSQVKKEDDKSASAKKLAKEMEKWAKNQNQKVQRSVSKPIQPIAGFDTLDEEDIAQASLPQTSVLDESDSVPQVDPFELVTEEESKLIDKEKLACLLCKRQFNTDAQLQKHQDLSDLHKNNLRELRRNILTEEQLAIIESAEQNESASAVLFRDRAKERRQKYGLDDTVAEKPRRLEAPIRRVPSPPMREQLSSSPSSRSEQFPTPLSSNETVKPIGSDSIGSRMLKAMGWTEGSGLGKSAQGISDIIQVEHRRAGLGLGNNPGTAGIPLKGESYQDAVKRTAADRFRRMTQSEQF